MHSPRRIATALFAFFWSYCVLANGVDGALLGPELFERSKGEPVTETREFTHDSAGDIVIRIYNGGPPGGNLSEQNPVTSAEVKVAGQSIFSPSDFKQSVGQLERLVTVGPGTQELALTIDGEPGSRLVLEILSAPSLVAPSDAVRGTAEVMLRQLPGAQVDYGQRTGHVISVRSPGLSRAPSEGPPIPLSQSRGIGDEELASALIEFFDRFRDVWGMDNPPAELSIARRSNEQYDNIGIPDPSNQLSLANLRVLSMDMANMHQGIRVLGRYAHGVYDETGNLQLLTTNIEPVLKGLDPKPVVPEQVLLEIVQGEIGGIAELYPTLWWIKDSKQPIETGTELVWLPPQKGETGLLRLAWDFRVRNEMQEARFWIDAKTGEVLRAIDITPSDWFDEGTVAVQDALDEANNSRSFPTTLFDDEWYMGYGSPYTQGNAPYFGSSARFRVTNNLNAEDRTTVSNPVQSISATGGNRWGTDSRFTGQIRAAASMADNVTKVLDWWAQYGWLSWDGRSSSLLTGVNGNRTEDGSPQFNAFGGNGGILSADGVSFGYTYAGSLEIIGHEFMHSVIDATTALEYFGESGAINESLADLFGVAITAVSDSLNNNTFGEFDFSLSGGLRDFVLPRLMGQPQTYSSFVYTTADAGGVHTNSGILNRAHAIMILGRPTIPGTTLGISQITEIIRSANQYRLYSANAGMDEFSAAIRGYCRYLRVFLDAFGRDWPSTYCGAINWAYSAVGLAPFNIDDFTSQDDVAIEGAYWTKTSSGGNKRLWIEILNKNLAGAINRIDLQNVFLVDAFGDLITMTNLAGAFATVPCGMAGGSIVINAGSSSCLWAEVTPATVDGYLTGPVEFDVELTLRDGDSYPADNVFPATIAPDYLIERTSITNLGPTMTNFRARVGHALGGFPAGIQGRYLVRNGNTGPLSVLGELSELTTEAGPECTDLSSSSCDPRLSFLDRDIELLQTELAVPRITIPSATRIPGSSGLYEVWVDERLELPTTSPGRQFFALMDSSDIADESDETNNLICVNCVQSADADFVNGVRVRLPEGVDVDSFFPITVRNAARKLPSRFPRLYDVREIVIPDLGHPIIADIPGPF